MSDYKPVVGEECEGYYAKLGDRNYAWNKCLVIYNFEGESAVKDLDTSYLRYCDQFRPIRTQEELEREEAIEDMAQHIDQRESPEQNAEWLYNAGYRLVGEKVSPDMVKIEWDDSDFLLLIDYLRNFNIFRKVVK